MATSVMLRAAAGNILKGTLAMVLGCLVLVLMPHPAAAAGNTCTWTGGGADGNWSTVGNWSGCAGAAPTNEDDLVFPSVASRKTNVNDLTALKVSDVDIFDGYVISGTDFTVFDSIDADTTVNQGITISNNIEFGRFSAFGGNTVVTHTTAGDRELNLTGTILVSTRRGDMWVQNGNVNFGTTTGSAFAFRVQDSNFSVGANSDFSVGAGLYLQGSTRLMCSHSDCAGDNAIYLFIDNTSGVNVSGDVMFNNPLFCETAATCIYTDTPGSNITVNGAITIEGGGSLPTRITALDSDDTSMVLNGKIAGVGNLELGPGNFTLNGNNEYDGDTIVAADTIVTSNRASSYGPAGNTVQLAGKLVLTGNSNYVLDVTVSGAGQIELTGSGEHSFVGSNFTGQLTVGGGTTYTVNGAGAQSATLTVNGGKLQGAGGIGSTTFTSGVLAPGNSPGLLTVTGDLTLAASPSSFVVELNGTAAGSGYDQVVVEDTAHLNNTDLQIALGFTPAGGDSFTILRAAAIVGKFNGLADGASITVNGTTFTIRYLTSTTGEDSVVLSVPAGQLADTGQSAVVLGAVGGLLILGSAALGLMLAFKRGAYSII